MGLDKVAVLIPCYNEETTIKKVVEDWKRVENTRVYVYDNNSSDNTVKIAKEAGAIVRYELLQGKGNVVRRMFREINAECYILVDGDNTYPVDNAQEMIDAVLNSNIDMVIGDRLSYSYKQENNRRFHNFGNELVKTMINRMFKSDIKDVMTGYRAFSYDFVKTFPILSKGFEIETEMTIHALDKNMSIKNVTVDYRDRCLGSESKLRTIPDGIKVLNTIVQLYKDYKPMKFFGYMGLILMLLGLVFFIPVFKEYLATGLVPKFPTLIVCGFSVMTSIMSMFTGLMLETIIRKNKQDFEYRLIDIHNKFMELRGK